VPVGLAVPGLKTATLAVKVTDRPKSAGFAEVESVVAVVKAGEARRLPDYLAAVPLVLPLDIAASIAGTVAVRPSDPTWRRSRRSAVSTPFE